MRKRILLLASLVAALAAIGALASSQHAAARIVASCPTVKTGQLTIGTDNPAYPPWFAGGTEELKWKINDPSTGKGYESAVAYAIAGKLGFAKAKVKWTYVPFNKVVRTGPEVVRLRHQPDLDHARAREGRRVQRVVLRRQPGDRRQQGHEDRGSAQHRGPRARTSSARSSARRATRSSRADDQAVADARGLPARTPAAVLALKNKQIDGLVVDLPTAFYVTAVQVPNSKILGQFENKGKATDRFGVVLAKGNSLTACVNKAITSLRANGTLKRLQQLWLAKATGAPILK